jgi:hypothetical protein
MTRRHFGRLTAFGLAGGLLEWSKTSRADVVGGGWDPDRPYAMVTTRPLRVQPILMYRLPTPRPQASWKSWGGVQTEAELAAEISRIDQELAALATRAEFPLAMRPLRKCRDTGDLDGLATDDYDVTLLYACTGPGDLLRACLSLKRDTVVFVRRRSGPAYYWYEALSVRYLDTREAGPIDELAPADNRPAHVDDVVVDDYDEVLWRLRTLQAIQNLASTRVLALGGPWGKYAADAPQLAEARFGLKIIDLSYEAFAPRLSRARSDAALARTASAWTDRYLRLPGTVLETERGFVERAFVLYQVFKELMDEHEAQAFTIKSCMGTVIPMSETTACLSLGLLNDEGRAAFCESDFVVIPAGLLLYYLARRPVFLHNSTFPAAGEVTCAHCASPRRMDAEHYEPARIQTHYESDYGAATKVEFPIGQKVTFIDPEYSLPRWLGFHGIIRANPDYAICRSQQDVEIQGNWKQLVREVRDSHWLMVYGDYLRECGYAARKLRIRWETISPILEGRATASPTFHTPSHDGLV